MDGRSQVVQGRAVARAARERKRLSREDWIEAAIDGLRSEGPSALRIAPLARALGVTPGSFYWHFKDREELRDRVLQYWMNQMLRQVAAASQMAGRGSEQIRALPKLLVARGLPEFDAIMRRWAREDPVVAATVARADELRLRVVAAMFGEAGLNGLRAERSAKLLGRAFRGSSDVGGDERLPALQDLIEALLHDTG